MSPSLNMVNHISDNNGLVARYLHHILVISDTVKFDDVSACTNAEYEFHTVYRGTCVSNKFGWGFLNFRPW